MKVIVSIGLLFWITDAATYSQEYNLNETVKQLTELLHYITPRNDTINTNINKQIVKLLQSINSTIAAENDEHRSLSILATKVALTKKVLLYIKDNIKSNNMSDEIIYENNECVKELEINALTNPFLLAIKPNAWNETDYFISELLFNATVSLKVLKEAKMKDQYKMALFCKTQRLFDGSEESGVLPNDPVDINTLFIKTTRLLQFVNTTNNQPIVTEIINNLEILDPIMCKDGAAPIDNLRKIKKIHFCQKTLIFLKENITQTDASSEVKCCRRINKYPDTRPLLYLLGDFTHATAAKINEFIANLLVDVALDLKTLSGKDEEYNDYKKNLDFNIARLNMAW